MDKPVKFNNVPEVVRRITRSLESVLAVQEVAPQHGMLQEDFASSLSGFFSQYSIALPLSAESVGQLRENLGHILEAHGQEALDAIEGVTRLATKVALFTYVREIAGQEVPQRYLAGLFGILSGLPLEQLGSTSNKLTVPQNKRTVRDRVSDLLTLGKDRMPGQEYMLNLLLPDMLPPAAERVRRHGEGAYLRFIDSVLTYANGLALQATTNAKCLVGAMEVAKKILDLEAEVGDDGADKKLTPEVLAQLVHSPDLATSLAQQLGSRVVAVGFSGNSSGVNRKAILVTANGGTGFARHVVSYGSSPAPQAVVDALHTLNAKCQQELKPSDVLYGLNVSGSRSLHHLSER